MFLRRILTLIIAALTLTSPTLASERVVLKMRNAGGQPEASLSAGSLSRLRNLKRAFHPANKQLASKLGLDRWYVADCPGERAEAVRALRQDKAVESAAAVGTVSLALTPNDPQFSTQWALNNTGYPSGIAGADIHAEEAWDITTGSSSVTVAVIDTGIDAAHPEFAGRIVAGYNFVKDNSNTDDDHGHGTNCAGIVGAAGNNNTNISGILWDCRLMPVKVVASNGNGENVWLADGVIWAVDNGADVISMSLVVDEDEEDVDVIISAVAYATESGVPIAAAMGNDSSDRVRLPAAIPSVIAVTATTRTDARAGFANYGPHIDVGAPGLDVLTTARGGGTANFSGTSAATPHVAAICALVLAVDPSVTPARMQELIRQGADDITPYGFDTYTGTGRVNAHRTLLALQDSTPPSTPGVLDSGRYTTNPNSLSFSWTASSDPESGILLYEYAIGTASDPTSVRSWSSAGTGLDFTAVGLSLATGETYYVSVRAKSGVQAVSEAGVSDGIMYAFPVATIGQTRSMANGTYVTILGRTATACFPDRFWITDPDRAAALAVDGLASVGQGEVVTVAGRLETEGCLRLLKDPEVLVLSSAPVPASLGMAQATLGGESIGSVIAGVTGGAGLNNIGTLVRVAGKVHNSAAQDFYLDDGSALTGFGGQPGVRVLTSGFVTPGDGAFLSVTGILECETHEGVTKPVVRIRSDLDVVAL